MCTMPVDIVAPISTAFRDIVTATRVYQASGFRHDDRRYWDTEESSNSKYYVRAIVVRLDGIWIGHTQPGHR
jgi:hypothetical protein